MAKDEIPMYAFWEVKKDLWKSYNDLTAADINYIISNLKKEIRELKANVKKRMDMLRWIEIEKSKRN